MFNQKLYKKSYNCVWRLLIQWSTMLTLCLEDQSLVHHSIKRLLRVAPRRVKLYFKNHNLHWSARIENWILKFGKLETKIKCSTEIYIISKYVIEHTVISFPTFSGILLTLIETAASKIDASLIIEISKIA